MESAKYDHMSLNKLRWGRIRSTPNKIITEKQSNIEYQLARVSNSRDIAFHTFAVVMLGDGLMW